MTLVLRAACLFWVATLAALANPDANAQTLTQTLPPVPPPPPAVIAPEAALMLPSSAQPEAGWEARSGIRAKVRAARYAEISAPISATIVDLPASEGHRLKKGEVIAKFDCTPLRAQLLVATSRHDAARTQYDVNQRLAKINNVSKLDLALSEADEKVSAAEVQGIRAQLARCTLTAPFAGLVTAQYRQAYEFTGEGEPILRLIDDDDLEIEMVAPSSWLTRLEPGTRFSLAVDEAGQSIEAKILYIVGEVDPVSQTVRIVGKPLKTVSWLTSGMSGAVSFGEGVVQGQ